MSKVKNRVKKHSVLVYEMTPKLANALSQLLDSRRHLSKKSALNNPQSYMDLFYVFVGDSEEVCNILEGMVVNTSNNKNKTTG